MISTAGLGDDSGSITEVLPFARSKSDLLAPQRTGDYAIDCATGRTYAGALLKYMRIKGFPPMLGRVAQAIAAGGAWDGVEIGFFHGIAAGEAPGPFLRDAEAMC